MIRIELPSEEGLKELVDEQMNEAGQIVLDNNISMQVIPEDDFNFVGTPELMETIHIALSIAGNIALNIVASWLYEKIKDYKLKTVKIEGKQYNTENITVHDIEEILEEQNNIKER